MGKVIVIKGADFSEVALDQIELDGKIRISVAVNPANSGVITGGGIYNEGESVTLVAVPVAGYTFVEWNDGNTNASRTVTVGSTAATYTATFEQETEIDISTSSQYYLDEEAGNYYKVENGKMVFATFSSKVFYQCKIPVVSGQKFIATTIHYTGNVPGWVFVNDDADILSSAAVNADNLPVNEHITAPTGATWMYFSYVAQNNEHYIAPSLELDLS